MAKQTINLGTAPSGAGGDDRRSAWLKAIANFDELYSLVATAYLKTNVLGTVSQTAGAPTGALFQRGQILTVTSFASRMAPKFAWG